MYMYQADSVSDLKNIFLKGEAFEINSFFRHDLGGGKYEVEITDKYCGHDLQKVRAEKAEHILADTYVPEKNGPIVFLVCSPPIDFEAHRQQEHARIKRENQEYAERKAKEQAEEAAEKARKEQELAERIAKRDADAAAAKTAAAGQAA